MSNQQQTETKQMKNTTRHEGATAPLALGPRMIGSINYEGYLRYMSNQQQTNMKEDQYKHKQQFSNVLNDIVFMTDFILTNEPERNSLSYCIIDHIKDHDPAVYKKDQAWYRAMKNALRHQGATAPPRPKKKDDEDEEDPIKCDRCNANTYRSHQECPDTWQYDYMAFCKDCQKEDSEDEEEDYKYVKQYLKCSDEDLTDFIQKQYLEL